MKKNNFYSIKFIAITVCLFVLTKTSIGQCTNFASFGSATAPTTTTPLTISTCTYNQEYNTIFSVVAGETYVSTNSSGGCITVHSGTPGGPVEGFGPSPLTWTALTSGTYYIHYNVDCSCATATGCITTTITCTSCTGGGGGATDPCLGITNIAACATPQSITLSGAGFGWNITACGFTTSGDEQIYSFTAPTTGTYSLTVTSASGGFIDYFWVNSIFGCGPAAPWNCIDDIIFTGTFGSMPWVAGETYYILLDAESSFGPDSQTFMLDCPTGGGGGVTASECTAAVNVCTNLTFAVDPSGFGAINEICTAGTCVSNPNINPASGNSGCLLAGELNSTWMVVNIATAGNLEFSFGAPGGGVCFDWIMWPYSPSACGSIFAGTLPPVRCNWNGTCDGHTGIASPVPAGGFANDFEPPLAVAVGDQFVICFSNYSSATTTVPLNFFGTATVSCVPLSIELTSFSGFKSGDDVMLNWIGKTEIDVMHYDILHSINSTEFTNIARVSAKELASLDENYEFKHIEPSQGINYYKLLKTDLSNKTEESSVVAINFDYDGIKVGDIYPNPTDEISYLELESQIETDLFVIITDLAGKIIERKELHILKGQSKIKVSSNLLAKGIYQVTIKTPDSKTNQSQKLIIK